MSAWSLLVALAVGASPVDELERHLTELSAPEVDVRQRAELWLGQHVDTGDYRLLARQARSGDAEVRLRIGRVVSVAGHDLSLPALFLAESDPGLAAIGERAIRERIVRWNPAYAGAVSTDRTLQVALANHGAMTSPATLRLAVDGTLAEACALLERRVVLPLGLAVEPALRERRRLDDTPPELVGPWNILLDRLAAVFGVALVGHGLDPSVEPDGSAAFLRYTQPAGVSRPTLEVLLSWCAQVMRGLDPERRVAAARCLASTGWPDALGWLETRFLAGDDAAGLEGVLHAAAAGRLAPALHRPETLRRLLGLAGEDLAAGPGGRARAERIADALGKLGCLGPGGESIVPLLLEDWQAAFEEDRWLRLVVLEETRCPGAEDLALASIQDAAAAPFVRRQALRALAAAAVGRPRLETSRPQALSAPGVLLAEAEGAVQGAELARLLVLTGFVLPATWEDPAALPGAWSSGPRVAAFGWFVGVGETAVAGAHLRALLAGARGDAYQRGRVLQRLLEPWRQRGALDQIEDAWRAARAGAVQPRLGRELDRLALLLGLTPLEVRVAVWEDLLAHPLEEAPDVEALGTVAGWGVGAHALQARERLLVLVRQAQAEGRDAALAAPLLDALLRTYHQLVAAGMDPLARSWRIEVRRIAARPPPGSAAGSLLGPEPWPRAPRVRVVDLAGLDRRLAP